MYLYFNIKILIERFLFLIFKYYKINPLTNDYIYDILYMYSYVLIFNLL